MTAAAKKTRTAIVGGTEHTDSSLEAMKTGEIAALVAMIRGGNPPKPATKAKAIELFWKAAEGLPKTPAVPDSKTEALEATTETPGTEKAAHEKAPKVKRYAIRIDGAEQAAKLAAMTPAVRGIVEAMSAAKRPLSMTEVAAMAGGMSKTKRPAKLVAWYFSRVLRPAGILVESRDDRGDIRVVSDACAVALVVPPDPLKVLKSLVLDAVSSPLTKRQYEIALDRFIAWAAGRTFAKPLVNQYRSHLEGLGFSPSTINQALSAIRRLGFEAADAGMLDPNIAAAVGTVKGVRREGIRTGNWLTRDQAKRDDPQGDGESSGRAYFWAYHKQNGPGGLAPRPL